MDRYLARQQIKHSDKLSVLMVEDNVEDQEYLVNEFELPPTMIDELQPRVTICIAGSLLEAEKCLREREYDVILLDLTLPDAKNLEGLGKLRRGYPETAIVIHSGFYTHEIAQEAIAMGAQDYILKGTMSRDEIRRALLRTKWVFDHGQRELYRLRKSLSH